MWYGYMFMCIKKKIEFEHNLRKYNSIYYILYISKPSPLWSPPMSPYFHVRGIRQELLWPLWQRPNMVNYSWAVPNGCLVKTSRQDTFYPFRALPVLYPTDTYSDTFLSIKKNMYIYIYYELYHYYKIFFVG